MSKITIVTVNWFSSDYIAALLDNLYTKASRPEDIGVLIVDNTNGQDTSIADIRHPSMNIKICPLDSQGLKGSRGHALALDYALKNVETEYAVIVDPDIYIFHKDWDRLCIEQMQSVNAVAVGAPYPCWKVGKYHDFPSPPFCFFHTQTIRQMENGWEPYGCSVFHNISTFIVRQIGRLGNLLTRKRYEKYAFLRTYATFSEKVFGVFSQDTGWKLAREVRRKGLTTITFDTLLPGDPVEGREDKKDSLEAMIKEYEVFAYQHKLFMAHKYGTGGLPWRTKQGGNETFWLECIQKLDG